MFIFTSIFIPLAFCGTWHYHLDSGESLINIHGSQIDRARECLPYHSEFISFVTCCVFSNSEVSETNKYLSVMKIILKPYSMEQIHKKLPKISEIFESYKASVQMQMAKKCLATYANVTLAEKCYQDYQKPLNFGIVNEIERMKNCWEKFQNDEIKKRLCIQSNEK